jgi:hypothetical protein
VLKENEVAKTIVDVAYQIHRRLGYTKSNS